MPKKKSKPAEDDQVWVPLFPPGHKRVMVNMPSLVESLRASRRERLNYDHPLPDPVLAMRPDGTFYFADIRTISDADEVIVRFDQPDPDLGYEYEEESIPAEAASLAADAQYFLDYAADKIGRAMAVIPRGVATEL
jgi:hypothetical protein